MAKKKKTLQQKALRLAALHLLGKEIRKREQKKTEQLAQEGKSGFKKAKAVAAISPGRLLYRKMGGKELPVTQEPDKVKGVRAENPKKRGSGASKKLMRFLGIAAIRSLTKPAGKRKKNRILSKLLF